MADNFSDYSTGLGSPYVGAEVVTPSDTVPFSQVGRGLYVGGAGDVSVVLADGTSVTLKAVPVGTFLPIRASRVNATGTTATSMVSFI